MYSSRWFSARHVARLLNAAVGLGFGWAFPGGRLPPFRAVFDQVVINVARLDSTYRFELRKKINELGWEFVQIALLGSELTRTVSEEGEVGWAPMHTFRGSYAAA